MIAVFRRADFLLKVTNICVVGPIKNLIDEDRQSELKGILDIERELKWRGTLFKKNCTPTVEKNGFTLYPGSKHNQPCKNAYCMQLLE